LAVFDLNYGGAAIISRIARQSLPAAAIHSGKPEVHGIGGHGSGTFEPAPLRGLPGQISQSSCISPNLDLSRAIHHHFRRAFAVTRIAATYARGPASLRMCERGRKCQRSNQQRAYTHVRTPLRKGEHVLCHSE